MVASSCFMSKLKVYDDEEPTSIFFFFSSTKSKSNGGAYMYVECAWAIKMIVFVRVCHTNEITDDQIPQAQRNHSFIASKVYYFVSRHIIIPFV